MFGNPLPYHFVSRAEKLPILTIVANNHAWHAVRNATLQVYPSGDAAKANVMPLTTLDPSPAFEKMIDVCGGYGECVGSVPRIFRRRSPAGLRPCDPVRPP